MEEDYIIVFCLADLKRYGSVWICQYPENKGTDKFVVVTLDKRFIEISYNEICKLIDETEYDIPGKSGISNVYFIKIKDQDLIKIGKADDVDKRLINLQCSSPFDLEVVHVIEKVSSTLERDLHKKFKHLRTRGEWFTFTDEIKEFIKQN